MDGIMLQAIVSSIMLHAIVSSKSDAWIILHAILSSWNGYGWDNDTSYSI